MRRHSFGVGLRFPNMQNLYLWNLIKSFKKRVHPVLFQWVMSTKSFPLDNNRRWCCSLKGDILFHRIILNNCPREVSWSATFVGIYCQSYINELHLHIRHKGSTSMTFLKRSPFLFFCKMLTFLLCHGTPRKIPKNIFMIRMCILTGSLTNPEFSWRGQ